MTPTRIWGCLLLIAWLGTCALAPAGDWAYDLAGGFRVVRGPTAVGNAPILLFPRGQSEIQNVVSVAYVQSETTQGSATLVEELGALGQSETLGYFIVRQNAQSPWLFASEAEWRKEAALFLPSFERRLMSIPSPGESILLPMLQVDAIGVLAENDAAIVGKSTTSGWFMVTKAHQELRFFPNESALAQNAASLFPGYKSQLFAGEGGLRNHATLAMVLSIALLVTWPFVFLFSRLRSGAKAKQEHPAQ